LGDITWGHGGKMKFKKGDRVIYRNHHRNDSYDPEELFKEYGKKNLGVVTGKPQRDGLGKIRYECIYSNLADEIYPEGFVCSQREENMVLCKAPEPDWEI
jgi:hypothetical protein